MSNTIRLRRLAETSKDENELKDAMKKLRQINPSYHWCPDWDFMVICDTDPEHSGCTCKPIKYES